MGSFNTVCGVTKHIVSCGEPVVLLPVVSRHGDMIPASAGVYISDRYCLAFHLPLFAVYDDYGCFDIEPGEIYDSFVDVVKTNYVKNELDPNVDSQYQDYVNVDVEDLFSNKMCFQDLMHDEKLFVKSPKYNKSKKSRLMFMVIKRSVWDEMVFAGYEYQAKAWNSDYYTKSIKLTNKAFDKISDMEALSKEELESKAKTQFEKMKNLLEEDFSDLGIGLEYFIGKTGCLGVYSDVVNTSYDCPFDTSNQTENSVRVVAKNRDLFYDLKAVISTMQMLNIEFYPQMYGRQSYNHADHAKLMCKLQLAGHNNDLNTIGYMDCNFRIRVKKDKLDQLCSDKNWNSKEPDLKLDNGKYVVVESKYGELNDYRDVEIVSI
ncbi:hypothetical protein ZPAH1_orf00313 [Aeromonas phage ZPAH1]|nr:hypothetical protein ZPAH1_orf00313 [Aeromonas phage ZPAH1]